MEYIIIKNGYLVFSNNKEQFKNIYLIDNINKYLKNKKKVLNESKKHQYKKLGVVYE